MPRHIPMRACAVCRTVRPKAELIRLVRAPDGSIELDTTGRVSGRGAYVCRAVKCAETAVRKDVMRRALGQPLPSEVAQQLLALAREAA